MTTSPIRRDVLIAGSAALALCGCGAARQAAAQGATPLKVMSFPGLSNYPIFAAEHQQLFAKHGLAVTLAYTPSSQFQRDSLVVRYLAAIIEGRRWLLDPANKAEAIKLAVDRVKLARDIAARAYDYVIDPVEGFHKDAQFDVEGFNNVLKLRAEIEGQWGGKPLAADKYVDLSYYKKAIASL